MTWWKRRTPQFCDEMTLGGMIKAKFSRHGYRLELKRLVGMANPVVYDIDRKLVVVELSNLTGDEPQIRGILLELVDYCRWCAIFDGKRRIVWS